MIDSAAILMNAPSADSLVKIATLKKPYGIKGWLWVYSETENHDIIFDMQPWWMKTASGFKPLTVSNWRRQGSGLVAQFEQIADRNMAEIMNGVSVWVAKDAFPEAADDEYYLSELIGLRVVNKQDECLGTFKELFETGAHEVMVIKPSADSIDDEERLIPWHKQTIDGIDLDRGQLTVDWERDF